MTNGVTLSSPCRISVNTTGNSLNYSFESLLCICCLCFSSDKGKDESNSDDHYYENKLVDDITAPTGVRTVPSKETLKEFVNK